MNREIKFRAWDKQTGKMHYLANQPYNEEIVDDELIVQICCTGAVGYTKNKYIGSNCLMQFTGLLDKNGKEIFEKMEIDNKFIVDFQNGSYILRNISNNDIIYFHDYIKQNEKLPKITREYSEI